MSELKVGVELDHKSERWRDVLVDLRYHQTRTELRQDRIEDPVVVAVNVNAEYAKVLFDIEIAQ